MSIRVTTLIVAGLALACRDPSIPRSGQMTVISTNPAAGPLAGGTVVTIYGTNFVDISGVTVGGRALLDITWESSTQISGRTPAGTGSGNSVVVVNSNSYESANCASCFAYDPAVGVVGISPATGPLSGGTAITISGTNFVSVTSVMVGNGLLQDVNVVSSTQITGTTPPATSYGARDVTVNSSSLASGTCTGCFVYSTYTGATWAALTAGWSHTCGAPTSSGSAYCWGLNTFGQQGDGYVASRTSPVAVGGGMVFASLTAYGSHTCALTNAGAAYCWGLNDDGQLGNGSRTQGTLPVAVAGGIAFRDLTGGNTHACGLTTGGTAYCWGSNTYGQLGDGTTTTRTIPVAVGGGIVFASLSAGGLHTCGLTSAGKAYCWGSNGSNRLGDGTSTLRTTPTAVAGGIAFESLTAGGAHTCGLSTAGVAYCWGSAYFGQLGNGDDSTMINRSSPTRIAGGLTFGSLSAGGDVTCGLTGPGVAYCWGGNAPGQLGNGASDYGVGTPVPVGGGLAFAHVTVATTHACAVTSGGAAYCWGSNGSGQLGDGSTTIRNAPVAVGGGITFSHLTGGATHTCGLTGSGAAYCWGATGSGYLGDGSASYHTTPWPVGASLALSSLAGGTNHTCGRTPAGEAYCWGANASGQLGDGTTTTRGTPVAVSGGILFASLVAGSSHTCGLTSTGIAYCWGNNLWGRLGDGTSANRLAPVAVAGGLTFSSLTAGDEHTCGVTDAGVGYCWGNAVQGRLGNGARPASDAAVTAPVPVSGGITFASITAGENHTCGLSTAGVAFCWGNNSLGQLGFTTGQQETPGVVSGGLTFASLTAGPRHTCGVTNGGAAYCWGRNDSGQLGSGGASSSSFSPVTVSGGIVFASLTLGLNHTCGVSNTGTAYCWGSNLSSQLGDGTRFNRASPVPVMSP